jgi:hypothetical protein
MRVAAAVALALAAATGGCFDLGGTTVDPYDYITDRDYSRWTFEVDIAGEGPPAGVLEHARSQIEPLVRKERIEFAIDERLPAGDLAQKAWTDDDVRSFARQHRGRETGDGTVVTHLLFLAGHSAHDDGNARVLGVAYGHDLIVLFPQSIKASCDSALPPLAGLCSPDPYFRAVLVHEIGHALGLVDNGIPMVRNHEASTCDDRPDSGHSSNSQSVMYCAVESSAIVPLFGSDPPTSFDADDRNDVRAAGGK